MRPACPACLVHRRVSLDLFLYPRWQRIELCLRDQVLVVSGVAISRPSVRNARTHSFHTAAVISLMVTPRSLCTNVHQGLSFVMMMMSAIRGIVAGSSFLANGRSLSLDSGLNPPT